MINFINPLDIVIEAYKNLYGDEKTIYVQFNPHIKKILFFGHWGETEFFEDNKIIISLSPHLKLPYILEILAHELAHVAAGIHQQHNQVWENCFERIRVEFDKIYLEEFDKR
jgi:hypothetical protein